MIDRKAVLVVGATGLVGSAVSARLVAEGFHVIAATHRSRRPAQDNVTYIRADLAQMRHADNWLPLLKDVHAVVNCAGILQDGAGESVRAVHQDGPAALFAACESAGVERIIHLSAIGVDRQQPTPFSRSKATGDAALVSSRLDWVILRPSVIAGRQAYGGSALFRGLASLPFTPDLPEGGELQVVQLDEVVETILFFLRPGAPAKVALELAGPERLSFEKIIAAYRSWYG